ncbi:MAG: phosphotransferase [Pirellulaceae bacterium]
MGDVPESILHSLQMNFRVSHVRPSAGGWGLSGARVYQAVSTNKSYCLRRWPAATTSARLGEVHGFMRRYRDAGCLLVPEVFVWPTDQSWRHDGAHFWDLTQWMSGRSLTRSEIDRETLILAIQAIASLHRLAGLQGSAEQIPPAITARIARIDAIIRQQLFAKTTGCVGALGDLASRGERLWRESSSNTIAVV